MRVLVTGANGFIGSAVVRELQQAGHSVAGLARSGETERALRQMDVHPFRGDLENADSLREAASASDGVIHLAFMHGLSKLSLARRLHVLFGGWPAGIVARFLSATTGADRRAIDALAAGLEGSGRPLVTTFGTLGLASGEAHRSMPFAESDAPDPRSPGFGRAMTESTVEAWAARGVRTSIVRLPPSVHGDGDAGFVPQLIHAARKKRCAAYVGGGHNRWPAVHRLDAARLFRLALERGEAGARYHGVAEEGIAFRDIAAVIGRRLDLPVASRRLRKPRHISAGSPRWCLSTTPPAAPLPAKGSGGSPVRPGYSPISTAQATSQNESLPAQSRYLPHRRLRRVSLWRVPSWASARSGSGIAAVASRWIGANLVGRIGKAIAASRACGDKRLRDIGRVIAGGAG